MPISQTKAILKIPSIALRRTYAVSVDFKMKSVIKSVLRQKPTQISPETLLKC